jgi:hypothetical protein
MERDEQEELGFLLEALESAYKSNKNRRPEEARMFEEAIANCKKRIEEIAGCTKK